jgi:hypothetical protein
MYLDDLRSFCKTLHYLPGNEIRAVIDDKLRLLEQGQRLGIPHEYDYGEFVGALKRLRQYTFDTGIPPGTTEDEGDIFAEVVEKKLR